MQFQNIWDRIARKGVRIKSRTWHQGGKFTEIRTTFGSGKS